MPLSYLLNIFLFNHQGVELGQNIYQTNKKPLSFIHNGTKNIKSINGDKLGNQFHPRSTELNGGKYCVENIV